LPWENPFALYDAVQSRFVSETEGHEELGLEGCAVLIAIGNTDHGAPNTHKTE
jgi:hypothetical protein